MKDSSHCLEWLLVASLLLYIINTVQMIMASRTPFRTPSSHMVRLQILMQTYFLLYKGEVKWGAGVRSCDLVWFGLVLFYI